MLAIIDFRTPASLVRALERLGHTVLPLPPHPALPSPVCAHPDMLLFFSHDRILCTEEYARIAKRELEQIAKTADRPIHPITQAAGPTYPHDILLNAAPVGGFLFCHATNAAMELTEDPSYVHVPVRQGYAKCATVPVGASALITADASISAAARHVGVDCLTVSQSHIKLTGYDTGFLGGATSFAPYANLPDILFCGALPTHPQGAEISSFCNRHQKQTLSLTDDPLTDVGTVFLI